MTPERTKALFTAKLVQDGETVALERPGTFNKRTGAPGAPTTHSLRVLRLTERLRADEGTVDGSLPVVTNHSFVVEVSDSLTLDGQRYRVEQVDRDSLSGVLIAQTLRLRAC